MQDSRNNIRNIGAFLTSFEKASSGPNTNTDTMRLLKLIVDTGEPQEAVSVPELLSQSELGIANASGAIKRLQSAGFVEISQKDSQELITATELGQKLARTL